MTGEMEQVSRPMQIALIAVVGFALVWFVALRPKSSSGGGAATPAAQAPGVTGLGNAVDKAKQAVGTANGASGASTGSSAATTTATPAPAASDESSSATAAKPAHEHANRRAEAARHADALKQAAHVRIVRNAVREHKAVALAFVDSSSADARAVAAELRHVSDLHGRAVVLSAPLDELSAYGFITNEVQVSTAPTIVIVAPNRSATTIVGYADATEIQQRLRNALAKRGGA